MFFPRRTKPASEKTAVPLEIYASLVDALYDDRRSLFIGSATASLAALMTAWKSGHWILFAFGVSIAIVAYARSIDMSAYIRVRESLDSTAEVRQWEHRYVLGASVYLALLGGWVFFSFFLTSDAFIHLFSFTVMFAYMIGTFGRNFASRSLGLGPVPMRGRADERRAIRDRRGLLFDLRPDRADLLPGHDFDLRTAAQNPPRRGDRDPRRHPTRQAIRYGADEHAARSLHVRFRPPPGRGQRPPGRSPEHPAPVPCTGSHRARVASSRASAPGRRRTSTSNTSSPNSRNSFPAAAAISSSRSATARRSPSPLSRWTTAAPSSSPRTSPSGATPRRASTVSPVTTS